MNVSVDCRKPRCNNIWILLSFGSAERQWKNHNYNNYYIRYTTIKNNESKEVILQKPKINKSPTLVRNVNERF